MSKSFEETIREVIEEGYGMSMEEAMALPIDELKKISEKKHGKKTQVVSYHPEIISHEEVEAMLDKALKINP